LDKSTLS